MNGFRVYRKLITRSSHTKSLFDRQRDAPTAVPLVRFDRNLFHFVSRCDALHIYHTINTMPSKSWKKSFLKTCLGNARESKLLTSRACHISAYLNQALNRSLQLPVFLVIPANGKNFFKTNYILTVSKLNQSGSS